MYPKFSHASRAAGSVRNVSRNRDSVGVPTPTSQYEGDRKNQSGSGGVVGRTRSAPSEARAKPRTSNGSRSSPPSETVQSGSPMSGTPGRSGPRNRFESSRSRAAARCAWSAMPTPRRVAARTQQTKAVRRECVLPAPAREARRGAQADAFAPGFAAFAFMVLERFENGGTEKGRDVQC